MAFYILNVGVLFLMSFSQTFQGLLMMSLLVGLCASAIQMIVPFGASMAPENVRGATIGTIMSGLLFGIMLARPLSSFFSGFIGWNGVFQISGGLIFVLAIIFLFALPLKSPSGKMSYPKLLASMLGLFVATPILRQRGFYHFLAFGAFCLFWIVSPLVLIEKFGFGANAVALFTLVGVTGALCAPIAGRLADAGKSRWTTNIALLCVGFSMLLAALPIQNAWGAFIWLAICGIVLDFGVSLNLVVGQRMIYALAQEIRARLNALYMVMFFIGGALGSYLGGYVYAHWGYEAAFCLGGLMGLIAFFTFRWNLRKNH
ncbi:MFS transporter [Helicobacter sp. 12S02232-10]|uniref:MFS transporter n=1 Tax=Helicobacter sp. 12S02232-10 TaxID=1476197 RepID=UPI00117B3E28|nr:MFS transporter [Helicobacter sp. 12S02232-10]